MKCAFSFPFVEVKFYEGKDEIIDDEIMTELFHKGKKYKINFCFLPQLKSNGANIPGSKFYVFTYNDAKKLFKKEKIDYENFKQNIYLNY